MAEDVCFNCASPCGEPFLGGRITNFTTTRTTTISVQIPIPPQEQELIQMDVSEALGIIFEGALKYSKTHIPNNDKSEGGGGGTSVGLCFVCGSILIDLYDYYTKFMALSVATSGLAQCIKRSTLWSFSCDEETQEIPSSSSSSSFKDKKLVKQQQQLQHKQDIEEYIHDFVDDFEPDNEDEPHEPFVEVKLKPEPPQRQSQPHSSLEAKPPPPKLRRAVVRLSRLKPSQIPASFKSCKKTKTKAIKVEKRGVFRTKTSASSLASAGKKLKCPDCPKYFKTGHYLNLHTLSFHKSKLNSTNTHSCTICSKVLLSSTSLARHQVMAHGVTPDKQIPCTVCYKLIARTGIKRHMKYLHPTSTTDTAVPGGGRQLHKCVYCDNSYGSPETLYNHILAKHGEEVLAADPESVTYLDQIQTPITDNDGGAVKSHLNLPNNCRTCNIRFNTKLAFLQHKLTTHPEQCTKSKKFKCDEVGCGAAYWYSAQLQVHVANVHGGGGGVAAAGQSSASAEKSELLANRTCDICNKVFPYPSLLKTHQDRKCCSADGPPRAPRKRQGVQPGVAGVPPLPALPPDNKCAVCGAEFEGRLQYTDHARRFHKNQGENSGGLLPYYCEECHLTFIQRRSYRVHASKVHGIFIAPLVAPAEQQLHNLPPDLSCSVCSKVYKSKTGLREHLLLHKGIKRVRDRRSHPVKGQENSDDFPDPSLLNYCTLCHKSYTSAFYLKMHTRIVHLKTAKYRTKPLRIHTCTICGKIIKWTSNYNKHLRDKHSVPSADGAGGATTTAAAVVCELCGKGFKDMSRLNAHLRSNVHEDSSRIYQCLICARLYSIEANYLRHMELHGNIGLDGFSIDSSGNVPQLISVVNPDSASLTCNECGKVFVSSGNLKRHLYCAHSLGNYGTRGNGNRIGGVEATDRPSTYDCTHCGRSFKIKSLLVQHLKTKQHGGPGLGSRVRVKNPRRIIQLPIIQL